jgi:hypothetical protein
VREDAGGKRRLDRAVLVGANVPIESIKPIHLGSASGGIHVIGVRRRSELHGFRRQELGSVQLTTPGMAAMKRA